MKHLNTEEFYKYTEANTDPVIHRIHKWGHCTHGNCTHANKQKQQQIKIPAVKKKKKILQNVV